MTAFALLLIVAAASWAFRVAFILVVPAHRLPGALVGRLDVVGPAAFAALLGTHLGASPDPVAAVLAVAVAGLVAWRTRNHLLTVLAAVAAVAVTGV